MAKKFRELTFDDVYANNNKKDMLALIGVDEMDWDLMSEKEQLETLGIPLNEWIPLEDYLYHNPITPGLSSSGMKTIYHKTPKYYKAMKDKPEFKNRDALILGRAVHKYILEPDSFFEEYHIFPGDVRKNSAAYKKHVEDGKGKELIKDTVLEQIEGMAESLKNYYNFLGVLRNGMTEHAMFVYDEEFDCVLRVKADSVLKDRVLDLKTTNDASEEGFQKSVATYGYDLQAWLYLRICELGKSKKRMFGFVAVEKEKPYLVNGIMINPEDISFYTKKVAEEVLKKYSYCVKTGNWFGYEFDWDNKKDKPFKMIDLPNWYKYNIDAKAGFEG